MKPHLEEREPDEDEEGDEYPQYFAWNPPWTEYESADQVGSGEN